MHNTKSLSNMPEVGLVLLDESLKVIACDRGAAAILSSPTLGNADAMGHPAIPKDILEGIRNRKRTGAPYAKLNFRMGACEYVCRSYLVESLNGGMTAQSLVALHLERVSGGDEAIREAIAAYHLTEREEETLKGILMGLSTKEVADQMNISPNTVKAFSRLIMIKLGVTTRWGIIAKILGNRENMEEEPTSSSSRSRFRVTNIPY